MGPRCKFEGWGFMDRTCLFSISHRCSVWILEAKSTQQTHCCAPRTIPVLWFMVSGNFNFIVPNGKFICSMSTHEKQKKKKRLDKVIFFHWSMVSSDAYVHIVGTFSVVNRSQYGHPDRSVAKFIYSFYQMGQPSLPICIGKPWPLITLTQYAWSVYINSEFWIHVIFKHFILKFESILILSPTEILKEGWSTKLVLYSLVDVVSMIFYCTCASQFIRKYNIVNIKCNVFSIYRNNKKWKVAAQTWVSIKCCISKDQFRNKGLI